VLESVGGGSIGEDGVGGNGVGGDGVGGNGVGGDGVGWGGVGDACDGVAQSCHPLSVTAPSEDHVIVPVYFPAGGTLAPLYATPFIVR